MVRESYTVLNPRAPEYVLDDSPRGSNPAYAGSFPVNAGGFGMNGTDSLCSMVHFAVDTGHRETIVAPLKALAERTGDEMKPNIFLYRQVYAEN